MAKEILSLVPYLIEDVLNESEKCSVKRMFGGWGIYYEKHFFAICDGEKIFLKVPQEIATEMEEKGSEVFSYNRNGKIISMKHYFFIPEEIFDDSETLKKWGRAAIEFSKFPSP